MLLLVHSKQEALAYYHVDYDTNIAPSTLLVDTDEEFEQAVEKTRINFKEILDAQSTQLWTGNGIILF